jgi:hypothetical protein
MNIVSAKYLYSEDGQTKTKIQLNLGTNDDGHTTYTHIPMGTNSDLYIEVMGMVEAGTLTIAEAD